MANENTAIVDLLALANRKVIADDPDDDILFAGSRKPDVPKPPVSGRAGMFTLPPPPPPPVEVAPYAAHPQHGYLQPAPSPYAAPPMRLAAGTQPPPVGMPMHAPVVPLPGPFVRQPAHAIGVMGAPSRMNKLYAIPAALGAVVVVLLVVYLASGDSKQAAAQVVTNSESPEPAEVVSAPIESAPVEAAKPAVDVVAAAPAIAEAAPSAMEAAHEAKPVEAAKPADMIAPPTVVDGARFAPTAEPTVATVSSTPIESATAQPEVDAEPDVKAPVAKKKSKRELAREKRAAKRAKRGAKARVAAVEPVDKAEKVEKAEKPEKAAKLDGNGALSITSSQPREVWVDGRNSKRMTPLRVLLKPGKHTVTLFDKEAGKAKTFDVEIKPNETTKIAK